ncbi:MAG: glycosyltransferase [Trueperaceae bacterium]|nr:glycosyltransferase [Trueperaceae bacterium]
MMPRPLRLAYLLPTFPELSNTFILEQITGMLDLGHEVDLFTDTLKRFDTAPPEVVRYGLARRLRHLPVPADRWDRLRSAARLLATPDGWHRASRDALNVVRYGREAMSLVPFHTAVSFVRAGSYDVLHCHFGQWGILGERLVRHGAIDAALVTSFRGADLARHVPANPERFQALFAHGDLHLPVSDEFRRRLMAVGVPSDRVVVHHDGIDLTRFAFAPRPAAVLPARLLFVGRLSEKKGAVYLLEALALLRQQGHDASLEVIGDGPLAADLRARCTRLGLDDRVRFAGAQPQEAVARAMAQAHALVAPSVRAASGDEEGIPTVLKEAMARGLPVVSTRHSGIPELVEHGVNGFLAEERDAAGLAAYLIELLGAPERWDALARAGRAKVEAEFDTTHLNLDLVTRYEEAIERRALRSVRAPVHPETRSRTRA